MTQHHSLPMPDLTRPFFRCGAGHVIGVCLNAGIEISDRDLLCFGREPGKKSIAGFLLNDDDPWKVTGFGVSRCEGFEPIDST